MSIISLIICDFGVDISLLKTYNLISNLALTTYFSLLTLMVKKQLSSSEWETNLGNN
uniref:Uncharacterized protein n=1 Tax=Picea glauca TaxID=3330 RepID=A0A101LYP5_PICGL|nr:hypothetical protein ABT39_MTgene4815 [Picea glauca]